LVGKRWGGSRDTSLKETWKSYSWEKDSSEGGVVNGTQVYFFGGLVNELKTLWRKKSSICGSRRVLKGSLGGGYDSAKRGGIKA